MDQKLEHGSTVLIDVPTRFPDLLPSKGTAFLPLLDLTRRNIGGLRGATPSLLILTDLFYSSGSAIPSWMFRTMRVASFITCKAECEQSTPSSLPLVKKGLFTQRRMTFS